MPVKSTNKIQLLSAEVQEIISAKPGWLLRNGITVLLVIIGGLFALTFFIRYPDIVSGNAKLISVNAPKEVKTRTDGKLVKLAVSEGELVKQDQILAYMETRANPREVMKLSAIVDTIQYLLLDNKTESIPGYLTAQYNNLGEVQQPYQVFMQGYLQFHQYLLAGYFFRKKKMLMDDLGYLRRQNDNLLQQERLFREDEQLAKETFDASQTLKDEKVLSALDLRNEKSRYIAKSMALRQITSGIISNENTRHEKLKEIMQLENEIAQQKEIFSQSLNTLKAQLAEWRSKYLLIAPITGKIVLAGFFQENQQLQNNQVFCHVDPGNTQYFAEVYIPQGNFGKVKEQQPVMLKLRAYPFEEFGAINGRVEFISHIATDSGFLAKIMLPEGLKTKYKMQLPYHEGLSAQAEIITRDLRLSDRLLNSLRSATSNY